MSKLITLEYIREFSNDEMSYSIYLDILGLNIYKNDETGKVDLQYLYKGKKTWNCITLGKLSNNDINKLSAFISAVLHPTFNNFSKTLKVQFRYVNGYHELFFIWDLAKRVKVKNQTEEYYYMKEDQHNRVISFRLDD